MSCESACPYRFITNDKIAQNPKANGIMDCGKSPEEIVPCFSQDTSLDNCRVSREVDISNPLSVT
ncbi:MAG: hypothetical protein M1450_00150 [Patescibacteria group bacterium]|nr:hypothetical protein [Patescibacteria group bacterium]